VRAIGCLPEIGAIYDGTVSKITDFGAFVAFTNREGLVHISQISNERCNKVSDTLSVGQTVRVKVIGIDDKGRIRLTMKGL
jgi:polyribonucleotide nucleotidyltransferase